MSGHSTGRRRGALAAGGATLIEGLKQGVGFARLPLLLGIGLVLAFSVLYWSVTWLFAGNAQAQRDWVAVVQFNFPGAEQGRYPNGTAFTSTDLVSPVVLGRVIDQLELDLSVDQLANRFQVAAHTPRSREVQRIYRQRLAQSDLSGAELQELERDFRTELNRAMLGRARLILTVGETPLPAQTILETVPAVWASYVRQEAGVFEDPLDLYSAEVVRASVIEGMDYLLAYDRFSELFGLLRSNINSLRAVPASGRVRSTTRQITLADIEAAASELESFTLEDALLPVLTLGISSQPESTLRFFEERIRRLQRQQELMEARADRVDRVLADYGPSGNAEAVVRSSQMGSQFGSDFLDRLVQLGVDGGEVNFRQSLSRERLDYVLTASNRESEIQRLERLVGRIQAISAARGEAEISMPDGDELQAISDEVERKLAQIRGQLAALFKASEEIADQLDRNRFGAGANLYTLSVASEPEQTARVFAPAAASWYRLGVAAMLLLAMLLAVVHYLWPQRR